MHSTNSGWKAPACLLLGTLLSATSLADTQRREHDAHEHGVAQFNVALDGSILHLELISPAVNIVGFEHHPASEAERQAVADAVATLRNGADLFVPDPAADCRLTLAEVDSDLLAEDSHDDEHHDDEHHDDEHHDDEHHGEMHSEFHVAYRFHCDTPDRLEHLDVKLFQRFPGTESLQARVIGPRGQSARRLSADDARLSF